MYNGKKRTISKKLENTKRSLGDGGLS